VQVPDPTLSQKLKADVKVLSGIQEAVDGMENAVKAARERRNLGKTLNQSDATVITNGEEKPPDRQARWLRSKATEREAWVLLGWAIMVLIVAAAIIYALSRAFHHRMNKRG
jgi:hypothetical protein